MEITDILSQNVPLEDVQYLAGHSNPSGHRSMTGVDGTSLATSWSVSRYERRTREERHPFEAC